MITGLHHFSIIASSEASVDFYHMLDFSEIFRKDRGYDFFVLMEGYGVGLEMYIAPTHPKCSNNLENLGFRALTLEVNSSEEMKKLFDCGLIQKDWFDVNYCLTEDSDGLPIQFLK